MEARIHCPSQSRQVIAKAVLMRPKRIKTSFREDAGSALRLKETQSLATRGSLVQSKQGREYSPLYKRCSGQRVGFRVVKRWPIPRTAYKGLAFRIKQSYFLDPARFNDPKRMEVALYNIEVVKVECHRRRWGRGVHHSHSLFCYLLVLKWAIVFLLKREIS